MQEFIVVYVTVGSAGEGERLARTLVEERLAACVNRIKSIQSVYRWQGKVEASAEELLIIKTKKELFRRLEKRVRALHSYTVPEIIALPVIAGSTPYLRWLKEQVAGEAAPRGGDLRTVKEVSAGGVIYRKNEGEVEIALIHVRNRWGLPKGHVEEGESIEATALREVKEETGLEGQVIKKLGDIRYSYRDKTKKGEPVRIYKRVYFFLLRYTRGEVQAQDHEVDETRWFRVEEAIKTLKFATERTMVHRAWNALTNESGEAAPPVLKRESQL